MQLEKIERFIEDFIIFYLITTKFMQYFGFISIFEKIGLYREFFEFVDIIVSMTGLAYVLYKSSLSSIFFGTKNKFFDFFSIFFYFFLIVNKFIEFNYVLASKGICSLENRFLAPLICYIANPLNSDFLINTGFYIGTIGLILLTLYATFKINISDKSILNALHEDNKTKKLIKFISSFFVIFGFYIIFFNFISEWFTRVLDAPIMLIALLIYFIKFHGKANEAETIIFKVSSSVENLIENFVNLFHDRKTIFLGISLMLVLHLISDLAIFIIPYNFGVGNNYVIESLEDEKHLSIIEHFNKDLEKGHNPILLFIGYFLNTIGTFYLMFFPLFIWFVVYDNLTNKKQRNFPNILIAIFFSCLIFMEAMPTYKITSLVNENLIGTDIQTQSLLTNDTNLTLILILDFLVFFVVLILINKPLFKDIAFFIMTIITLGFFGIYVYYYFISIFTYFISLLQYYLTKYMIYNLLLNLIFLVLITVFYIGSYLSFLIYVFKEDKKENLN
ncbi:MAG: hypothetical protein QXE31_00380 [Candidatus Woesearchaeota archaeon]